MLEWINLLSLLGALCVVLWVSTWIRQRYFDPPTPEPLTDGHIRRAVREGDMTTAIRWHRELHGSSFTMAKNAVEQVKADEAEHE